MPNATITIYLTGNDFKKYWDHREEINKAARELVKNKVKSYNQPSVKGR